MNNKQNAPLLHGLAALEATGTPSSSNKYLPDSAGIATKIKVVSAVFPEKVDSTDQSVPVLVGSLPSTRPLGMSLSTLRTRHGRALVQKRDCDVRCWNRLPTTVEEANFAPESSPDNLEIGSNREALGHRCISRIKDYSPIPPKRRKSLN
jgi:hypothetical protein